MCSHVLTFDAGHSWHTPGSIRGKSCCCFVGREEIHGDIGPGIVLERRHSLASQEERYEISQGNDAGGQENHRDCLSLNLDN